MTWNAQGGVQLAGCVVVAGMRSATAATSLVNYSDRTVIRNSDPDTFPVGEDVFCVDFTMVQSFEDSARNVWKTISDFGGIVRYCPSLSASVADGVEPGCHRTLTTSRSAGAVVTYRERMEAIDHETMTLTYSMPDTRHFPILDGYRSTMRITELSDDRCLLTWSAQVEPRDVPPEKVTKFLGTVYRSVFDGLRALHPEPGERM